MPLLFQMPEYLENAQTLETYHTANVPFNIKEPAHLKLIEKLNVDTLKARTTLQKIDKAIITGFAVGITSFILSSLPLMTMLATAGFAYSAWFASKRQDAHLQHQYAIKNLMDGYEWAVLKIATKNYELIKISKALADSKQLLTPVLTPKELKDLIDDQYENSLIQDTREDTPSILDRPLSQDEKHVYYGIYGYDQGRPMQIAQGLWKITYLAFDSAKEFATHKYQQYASKSPQSA